MSDAAFIPTTRSDDQARPWMHRLRAVAAALTSGARHRRPNREAFKDRIATLIGLPRL